MSACLFLFDKQYITSSSHHLTEFVRCLFRSLVVFETSDRVKIALTTLIKNLEMKVLAALLLLSVALCFTTSASGIADRLWWKKIQMFLLPLEIFVDDDHESSFV